MITTDPHPEHVLERIAARVQRLLKRRGFDPGDAELALADPAVEGSPRVGRVGNDPDEPGLLERLSSFPTTTATKLSST
jgi:hypothetical protein